MTAQAQATAEPSHAVSWARFVVVLALAVALGVYADEGQRLSGTLGLLPELGTPWVFLSFAAARCWVAARAVALVAGVGTVLLGLASYAVYMHVGHGVDYYNVLNDGRGAGWAAAALVVGAVAAGAALLSDAHSRVLAAVGWGFLVGVPLAETRFLAERGGADPTGATVVLVVVAASAAVLAVARCRSWQVLVSAAIWTAAGMAAVPVANAFL